MPGEEPRRSLAVGARSARLSVHTRSTLSATPVTVAPGAAHSRSAWAIAAIASLIAIALAVAAWRTPAPRPPVSWLSALPPRHGFGLTPSPALSPDPPPGIHCARCHRRNGPLDAIARFTRSARAAGHRGRERTVLVAGRPADRRVLAKQIEDHRSLRRSAARPGRCAESSRRLVDRTGDIVFVPTPAPACSASRSRRQPTPVPTPARPRARCCRAIRAPPGR